MIIKCIATLLICISSNKINIPDNFYNSIYLNIHPTGESVIISDRDADMLSWLLYVEVRGMGNNTYDSGLSVLSTVFYRTKLKYLSDGTLRKTVSWCTPDGSLCQFPAWVSTLNCDGIIYRVCPLADKITLNKMRHIVDLYLIGYRGSCNNYLYYNSIPGGLNDCSIRSTTTSDFMEFHR